MSQQPAFSLHRLSDLTLEQQAACQALSLAVYPPGQAWAGESIEWSASEWCVIGWDENQRALCYVGAIIRSGTLNDASVKIGGIGGVKTHPVARGKGLAASAIERAMEFFREQKTDFALLVCDPRLVGFYERLGWQCFEGEMFVTQRGQRSVFTFNLPMIRPVCETISATGVVDLKGPPW